jgi:Big-like domain-containing protein
VKTSLYRAGATLAAAALATSALMASAGTAHAADTAIITVTVVDQFGQPAVAAVQAYDQAVGPHSEGPGAPPISSTHTFTALPASGYGFQTIGPWSGIECFGVFPCTPGGATAVTPVVFVAEGGTASYTVRVTVPTVTGGTAIGSPLSVQTSPGFQLMQSLAAQESGLPGSFSQQWLRGTSDISGVTSPGYTTTQADAGQPVAARLTASPGISAVFAQAGYIVPPFTTRPVAVSKNATTTKASVARGVIKVKVKSAPGAVPDGKVKLKLGQFKATVKLKKGKATVALPQNLQPGTYTLKASYAGSTAFEASKSKKKQVKVT